MGEVEENSSSNRYFRWEDSEKFQENVTKIRFHRYERNSIRLSILWSRLTMIQQTSILGKTSSMYSWNWMRNKTEQKYGKEGGVSMKEQTEKQQDEGRQEKHRMWLTQKNGVSYL